MHIEYTKRRELLFGSYVTRSYNDLTRAQVRFVTAISLTYPTYSVRISTGVSYNQLEPDLRLLLVVFLLLLAVVCTSCCTSGGHSHPPASPPRGATCHD